jgi:hypothetical protein
VMSAAAKTVGSRITAIRRRTAAAEGLARHVRKQVP